MNEYTEVRDLDLEVGDLVMLGIRKTSWLGVRSKTTVYIDDCLAIFLGVDSYWEFLRNGIKLGYPGFKLARLIQSINKVV